MKFPCRSTQKPFIPVLMSGSFFRTTAARSWVASTLPSPSVTTTRIEVVSTR